MENSNNFLNNTPLQTKTTWNTQNVLWIHRSNYKHNQMQKIVEKIINDNKKWQIVAISYKLIGYKTPPLFLM